MPLAEKEQMMQPVSMKVGKLAKRTGISVRTLHYYEEIGLLAPTFRTRAGHRLYGASDVVRLQQIVSLRQLGFSLEEIGDCLKQDHFSLKRVIELHISRLKEEIETQARLCARLETIADSLASEREVSVDDLILTIEEVTRMEKYYTPEQLRELKERGQQLGEDGLRKAEADWQELMSEVRAEMDKGTDPSSDRVQELAKRWTSLVQAFTAGNPGIEKAAGRMWQQEENIHGLDTGSMREMMAYMSKAIGASKCSQ
jgi:DNA-binding transcriptional MerR regulator